LIEPILIKFKIEFIKLNKEEIYELIRKERIKMLLKSINKKNLINYLIDNNPFKSSTIPKEHQLEILNQIETFYKENDIGKIFVVERTVRTVQDDPSSTITKRIGVEIIKDPITGEPDTRPFYTD
jgi:hypothetical protein